MKKIILSYALLSFFLSSFSQGEVINGARRVPWWTVGNALTANPASPAVYGTSLIGALENFAGTLDAQDFVLHGANSFVVLGGDLLPVLVDGVLPQSGRVALLRLDDDGAAVGYPVTAVHDLAPLPEVTPINDPLVESFVMIDGRAVALLAWPRLNQTPKLRRKRA